jgi:hypothetical protein
MSVFTPVFPGRPATWLRPSRVRATLKCSGQHRCDLVSDVIGGEYSHRDPRSEAPDIDLVVRSVFMQRVHKAIQVSGHGWQGTPRAKRSDVLRSGFASGTRESSRACSMSRS